MASLTKLPEERDKKTKRSASSFLECSAWSSHFWSSCCLLLCTSSQASLPSVLLPHVDLEPFLSGQSGPAPKKAKVPPASYWDIETLVAVDESVKFAGLWQVVGEDVKKMYRSKAERWAGYPSVVHLFPVVHLDSHGIQEEEQYFEEVAEWKIKEILELLSSNPHLTIGLQGSGYLLQFLNKNFQYADQVSYFMTKRQLQLLGGGAMSPDAALSSIDDILLNYHQARKNFKDFKGTESMGSIGFSLSVAKIASLLGYSEIVAGSILKLLLAN